MLVNNQSLERAPAYQGLLMWLALCFVVAWFGSRFEPGPWYAGLTKPWWTPPDWLFGPVWTVLYAMMGVAAWLVWRRYGFAGAALPLAFFIVQLALNAAWTWLFFGLRRPDVAFAEIIVLWLAILVTLISFWRLERPAGILLVPYLAWVSFAALLNYTLWQLNR